MNNPKRFDPMSRNSTGNIFNVPIEQRIASVALCAILGLTVFTSDVKAEPMGANGMVDCSDVEPGPEVVECEVGGDGGILGGGSFGGGLGGGGIFGGLGGDGGDYGSSGGESSGGATGEQPDLNVPNPTEPGPDLTGGPQPEESAGSTGLPEFEVGGIIFGGGKLMPDPGNGPKDPSDPSAGPYDPGLGGVITGTVTIPDS